jgi:hypothetical protein
VRVRARAARVRVTVRVRVRVRVKALLTPFSLRKRQNKLYGDDSLTLRRSQ